jgi:hypothetical protein
MRVATVSLTKEDIVKIEMMEMTAAEAGVDRNKAGIQYG